MVIEQTIGLVRDIFSIVIMPLLTAFLFYDSRKRSEEAKAKQEEAAAKKADSEVSAGYATEWKELYEKKETKVNELEAKIDALGKKLEEKRNEIRSLKEELFQKKLEHIQLKYDMEIVRCDNKECGARIPPPKFIIPKETQNEKS